MKSCACHSATVYELEDWCSFQSVANEVNEKNLGFRNVPHEKGIYCLRVKEVGEQDVKQILSSFRQSPVYEAYKEMTIASKKLSKLSEEFFLRCLSAPGWGWETHDSTKELEDFLNEMCEKLPVNPDGEVICPILYFGCSDNLKRRMWDLMDGKHPLSVALWALLYSHWKIELAFRVTSDNWAEEEK